MAFGNMDHISKAIAAATAQWRGPEARLADALRVMQDSLRPQFNAMAAVSEARRGIHHDNAAALRSMFQQIDVGRSLAAQVAEAKTRRSLRQRRVRQHGHAGIAGSGSQPPAGED